MAKKNFTDDAALDFLGIEEAPKKEPVEIGKERIETPDGYILKPEPKSAHMHILVQESLKAALTDEAEKLGISKNELINRIFAERYRE